MREYLNCPDRNIFLLLCMSEIKGAYNELSELATGALYTFSLIFTMVYRLFLHSVLR